jgi:ABC-type Fe3+-hydroxamate transport system substrate-binding protein
VKLKREFVDQMQRRIGVEWPPQRIVSLVPSQTELLFYLGAGSQVAGVTDFCIEPPAALQNCQRVGGTKRFLFDRIERLGPDLLIGNREENYIEGIARLEQRHAVWMSDIETLNHARWMIEAIGELCDRADAAARLVREIDAAFSHLSRSRLGSAAYLIWQKPWMAAGSETFIDDMLRRAGFDNAFADRTRYPEITLDELRTRAPRFVLLSSEPFPFEQRHLTQLQMELPDARILLVDAMPFSWYGSRLLHAPAYFHELRQQCSLR